MITIDLQCAVQLARQICHQTQTESYARSAAESLWQADPVISHTQCGLRSCPGQLETDSTSPFIRESIFQTIRQQLMHQQSTVNGGIHIDDQCRDVHAKGDGAIFGAI